MFVCNCLRDLSTCERFESKHANNLEALTWLSKQQAIPQRKRWKFNMALIVDSLQL
jgi:hypothetical protein